MKIADKLLSILSRLINAPTIYGLSNFERLLYKLIPIIETDKLDKKYGAKTYCVFPITWIKIRPKYKHDIGLILHELTHVKQIYRTLGIHCILYKISWKYRLNAEIEAYARQLVYYYHFFKEKYQPEYFTAVIATKYNLPQNRETTTASIQAKLLMKISEFLNKKPNTKN